MRAKDVLLSTMYVVGMIMIISQNLIIGVGVLFVSMSIMYA